MVEKYSKDAPFEDPVMRCDSCQGLVKREAIQNLGMCPKCGNKRFRNVLLFTELEHAVLTEMQIDPVWMALFKGVEEA